MVKPKILSWGRSVMFIITNSITGNAITKNTAAERIYTGPNINQLYILTLFYNGTDPHTYINTVEKANPYAAFETVTNFDRYYFYLPEVIDSSENSVYIVPNSYSHLFSTDIFSIAQFEHYSVAVPNNLYFK